LFEKAKGWLVGWLVKKEGKGKINDKAGWLGLLHCCLVD